MIGIWSTYTNIFLYIVGIAMLLAYGLPLTFAPLRWGKVFGWETQPAGHLTIMLGRSLGILISLVAIFALLVPAMPIAGPFFFDFMLCLIGLMTILHIYNALRRQQPKLETRNCLMVDLVHHDIVFLPNIEWGNWLFCSMDLFRGQGTRRDPITASP